MLGSAWCKLCSTEYVVKILLFKCICISISVCKSFVRLMIFCAQDYALTISDFWRAEELRWVEMSFFQCSDEMKKVEKNFLRWHVRRDGMKWEELRWGDMRWEEIRWFELRWAVECEVQVWIVKCRVWRVQCEVWKKCSLGVALQCGRAQVMFLDHNSAAGSHKACAHGPGWRTAHASTIDEKGLIIKSKATSAPPRAGTTGNMI